MALDVFPGDATEVLDQAQRMRRRISVGAEEDLRIDHVPDLHVAAILAAVQVHAEAFLVLIEPVGGDVVVADRRGESGRASARFAEPHRMHVVRR